MTRLCDLIALLKLHLHPLAAYQRRFAANRLSVALWRALGVGLREYGATAVVFVGGAAAG